MTHQAFFALGSNLQPEHRLPRAVHGLARFGRVVAVSGVWQSPPADGSDQPDYCNGAVWLATAHDAEAWLAQLIPALEAAGGRVRDPDDPNAARTIDIDLVLFDDVVATGGAHPLPDPDLFTRAFVAVPLAECAPDLPVPGDGRTLQQIADALRAEAVLQPRPDIILSA